MPNKREEAVVEFFSLIDSYQGEMNAEAAKKVYKQLNALDLYLPIQGNGQIEALVNEERNAYLPVLTGIDEPLFIDDIVSHEKTDFQSIKHMVLHVKSQLKGIVVNPYSENLLFEKNDIEKMDRLVTGMSIERTEGFLSGIELLVPDRINSQLQKDIEAFGKENKNIIEIYVYKARRNPEDSYHYLFLIKFIGRDIDLFPRLAPVIQKHMNIGNKFELLQVNKELESLHGKEETLLYKL